MADTLGPIDAVYKQRYQANTHLYIQTTRNCYDGTFLPITDAVGREIQVVDLVGSSEVLQDEPESAPTPHIEPKHEGIFVVPRKRSWGRIVNHEAKLKSGVDYTGTYVQESGAAFKRSDAADVRAALFGARLIKATAAAMPSAVAFDLANRNVAVNYKYGGGGAASGLSVEKLVKGIERLGITRLDIDVEDIYLQTTMKQNTDLFNDLKVVNEQYAGRYVLQDKFVRSFMGVEIRIDPDLPVDPANATYRMCPLYVKSGIYFGYSEARWSSIERNVAQQYRPHIYNEQWTVATRSEDEKVVVIYCDETPAGA